jgi:hypothetical protein
VRWLFITLAALLWAVTDARAQGNVGDPDVTFHGGLYAGLVIGDVVRPDNGERMRGLKVSTPGSSEVPPPGRAAVEGFLRAYRTGRGGYSAFLTDDAVGIWCDDFVHCTAPAKFRGLPFAEKSSANTPYLVPDGRVRIEWSYKGMLYYLSWLTLRGDKISKVETRRAEIPHLLIRPAEGAPNG